MDGVPSITQCPIAPGDSYTYRWHANQYGTGWYHSHFYVQAWDGVFGGILINGPATANYDVDLGHLFLNDWYHVCCFSIRLTGDHSELFRINPSRKPPINWCYKPQLKGRQLPKMA